jgi:hypothetical protein
MKTTICFLLSALVFTILWAGALVGAPQPEKARDGEEVYKENCTRCHNTPPAMSERHAKVVSAHMRVRANLTARDANAVMHYLAENAKSK